MVSRSCHPGRRCSGAHFAVELVAPAAGEGGALRVIGATLLQGGYGYAVAACVAVGLATAGAYARGLVRFPDDYAARAACRIGTAIALIGLIGLPLARGVSAIAVGGSILVALVAAAALTWLWHEYAREPPWLLRAFVALSPFGLLAILAVRPVEPLAAFAEGTPRAIVAVDVVLFVLGAALFQRLARLRPDVRSLAAFTMEVSRHGGR